MTVEQQIDEVLLNFARSTIQAASGKTSPRPKAITEAKVKLLQIVRDKTEPPHSEINQGWNNAVETITDNFTKKGLL